MDRPRPEGMHRRTHAPLTAVYQAYAARTVAAMSARPGKAGWWLGGGWKT